MKQYDFFIRQSGTHPGNNIQHNAARFSSPSSFVEPRMKIHNQGNPHRKNSDYQIGRNSRHENFEVSDAGNSSRSFAKYDGHYVSNDNYWSSIPEQIKVPQFVKPLDLDPVPMSNFNEISDKAQKNSERPTVSLTSDYGETSDKPQNKTDFSTVILADNNQNDKQSNICPKCGRQHADKSKCDKGLSKNQNSKSERFGDEMLLIFLLLMLSGEKSNSCLMLAILYIFM